MDSISEKNSKASLLPHWDGEIYTKYAARTYDLVTTITGWRSHLRRIALSDLPRGGTLVDVGCGTGYVLSAARDLGYRVYGVDPSEGMLQKGVESFGFSIGDNLFCSGASELPIEDSQADVVICSGSLVHVPDLELVAEEFRRVLKPGGILRILDHADPIDPGLLTPLVTLFSQASGDILHDYEHYFSEGFHLSERITVGRGGYLQRFDFRRVQS